jgi:hypothetical protein
MTEVGPDVRLYLGRVALGGIGAALYRYRSELPACLLSPSPQRSTGARTGLRRIEQHLGELWTPVTTTKRRAVIGEVIFPQELGIPLPLSAKIARTWLLPRRCQSVRQDQLRHRPE